MDIYLFFVYGLASGLSIGLAVMFSILRKNFFEPGKATDHYPFSYSGNRYLVIALVLMFLSGIMGFLDSELYSNFMSGIILGLYVLYGVGMLLLNRQGLLYRPLVLSILALPVCVLLVPGYSSVIVGFVSAVVVYLSKQNVRGYNKRYYAWCSRRAQNLFGRYKTNFLIYDLELRSIMLTFMLVEDTARPKSVRIAEKIKLLILKRKTSSGIMQVKSTVLLSDEQSVIRGFEILENIYDTIPRQVPIDEKLSILAYEYNGDLGYAKFLHYFYDTAKTIVGKHAG